MALSSYSFQVSLYNTIKRFIESKQFVFKMALLNDLINLNLTDSTKKIIAEYIWLVSLIWVFNSWSFSWLFVTDLWLFFTYVSNQDSWITCLRSCVYLLCLDPMWLFVLWVNHCWFVDLLVVYVRYSQIWSSWKSQRLIFFTMNTKGLFWSGVLILNTWSCWLSSNL